MDEAERCHEIAYIAYGDLLTHGTVPGVIARAGLVTYTVGGESEALAGVSAELARHPEVMAAPFGNSLHVSSRDHAELEAAIARFRQDPRLTWARSDASLEDVFIDLMSRARDNFQ
jgi:ABC-2 type transport system ATP-binding protein